MNSSPIKTRHASAVTASFTEGLPRRWNLPGVGYPKESKPVKVVDWRKYYLRKKAKYRERMNAQARIRNQRYRAKLKGIPTYGQPLQIPP